MTAGLDDSNLHKGNGMNFPGYILLKFANYIFKSEVFDLPVTRKEIAEYAGVSTENIIRALAEFRKDKLIRISGKEIEILNMDRLTQISRFG